MQDILDDDRLVAPDRKTEDAQSGNILRPLRLEEYIGQERIKENLKVFIMAARKRGEPLDHVLFSGPPGLGKTTLAHIIAREMDVGIETTSGPVIEKPGDLAAILTNLQPGDILFIDEIHRLSPVVEEILYPAMEDYQLDILIGQGPSARSIKIDLPRFTLVGATTRSGLLTAPLRDRFGVMSHMEFYTPEELRIIVSRSAEILGIHTTLEGAWEIARRSRGTPRIANRLLRRVRDFAQVHHDGIIDASVADSALRSLDVDNEGLDAMDRRILGVIIKLFGGGPVGIETIAAAIGEQKDTVEDVYEPYMIQQGYLARTARGRIAGERAYRHLGLDPAPRGELL